MLNMCELTLQSYRVWVNSWDLLDSNDRSGRYYLVRNVVAYLLSTCLSIYLSIYLFVNYHVNLSVFTRQTEEKKRKVSFGSVVSITTKYPHWLLTQITKVKCGTRYPGSSYLYLCVNIAMDDSYT